MVLPIISSRKCCYFRLSVKRYLLYITLQDIYKKEHICEKDSGSFCPEDTFVLRTKKSVLRTKKSVLRTKKSVLRTKKSVLRTKKSVLRTKKSVLRTIFFVLWTLFGTSPIYGLQVSS